MLAGDAALSRGARARGAAGKAAADGGRVRHPQSQATQGRSGRGQGGNRLSTQQHEQQTQQVQLAAEVIGGEPRVVEMGSAGAPKVENGAAQGSSGSSRPAVFLFTGILSGRGFRHRRLAVREAWADRAQVRDTPS